MRDILSIALVASVCGADARVRFVQRAVAPGDDEITAARKLLATLTLDGALITGDAIHPRGIHAVEQLIAACDRADLPAPARKAMNLLADQLVDMQRKIEILTADIRAEARGNVAASRRWATGICADGSVPGGPAEGTPPA